MLEFLTWLEKKMPNGFQLSIKRTPLGFEIEFRYGKIFTHSTVTDHQLQPDMLNETKELFSEIIFDDMISKIRNHGQYRKQKAA